MKSKITILAAAAAFILLCSCASLSSPKHYQLTEKDSGRTLQLDKGDTFTVLLTSNPTTGFSWEFTKPLYDENVMTLQGDKYIRPDEQLMGAPGKRSLTFLAKGSGRTGLKLVYRRPWEKSQPPAEEFNVMAVVKDGTGSEQKH